VQLRSRHIQFGSLNGDILRPQRVNDCTRNRKKGRPPQAITTKTTRWQDFTDVCRRQGLDAVLELPGWYRTAKVRAVGNGVPLAIGRALAAAVLDRSQPSQDADCRCGCGRRVSASALTATASCRKRKQLSSQPKPWVDVEGYHDA
jgi:DNA (cytosine-5)-methyltransferase 1